MRCRVRLSLVVAVMQFGTALSGQTTWHVMGNGTPGGNGSAG